jgi:hypothetical protein
VNGIGCVQSRLQGRWFEYLQVLRSRCGHAFDDEVNELFRFCSGEFVVCDLLNLETGFGVVEMAEGCEVVSESAPNKFSSI